MIYEEFTKKVDALEYPISHAFTNKEEYRKARLAFRNAEDRITDELHASLSCEYGLKDHPREQKVWDLAWSYGHSGGYSDVESHYQNFAGILID